MSSQRTLITLLLVAVLGIATLVSAEPGEVAPSERMIPYSGYLEQDGAPFSGLVDIQFVLFDDGTNPTFTLHSERHVDVAVSAGRFSVLLGSVVPIPPETFIYREVWLQVYVDDNQLGGSQRLQPMLHAVRASKAYDFDVENSMSVGQFMSVSDRTDALPGTKLGTGAGRLFLNIEGNSGQVWLGNSFAAGTPQPQVIVRSNAEVQGDLDVGGTISADLIQGTVQAAGTQVSCVAASIIDPFKPRAALCCKINTLTGATVCSERASSVWRSNPPNSRTPFGASSADGAPYSLSCAEASAGLGGSPVYCCRSDVNGATACRSTPVSAASNTTFNAVWSDYGSF
jgi:hypothetical protein